MRERPNIVFLMTDHQRADSLGMVQCGREVTPNLNQLAQQGAHFTRAYTACPLCVPARTALATGKYPTHNKVVYNDWDGETASENETIHTLLKKEGYSVGYVGVDHIRVKPLLKESNLDYFVNHVDYNMWAKGQGIDLKENKKDKTSVVEEIGDSYESVMYSNQHVSKWTQGLETFKDSYFIRHGIEFLEATKEREEPFALFLYLWAPHPPLIVPEPYASMYDPSSINIPSNVNQPAQGEPKLRRKGVPAQLADNTSMEQWREAWAAHLGLTTLADTLIGEVLNKLKEMGIYDDTIVVFTGDHGEALGQHKMYQKMEMYEEMLNIPFIMKVPGEKPRCIQAPVSHLDIVPTLCELAAINTEQNRWDGKSLVQEITTGEEEVDRVVYAAYSGNPTYGTVRRAAITKRFKYVYDSANEHELYDLEKDPLETKNRAGHKDYEWTLETLYKTCKDFNESKQDYFQWPNGR